ncbi:MAG: Asp-tRNA(Asn)/Glu-tRNA(Gln) amidotransferase subunit GatB [Phycisphaeraceae bacterium]|nr:MAG: Asp-tRNA(Asn)/Glu-tRNA(Gln) amidotransferase subunit GatB [Phycisphaeraceae bacterium]
MAPMAEIKSVELKVGLEVHVELATRTKMFTRAPSPAHPDYDDSPPNTLIDPLVLGLPGALPVMNREAVEMSMLVGLALGCEIAEFTKWDRKSYYYPDLPKNYQISQYDLPLCYDGSVYIPLPPTPEEDDEHERHKRIGIIRAHLEEDSGKLLHELPGGHAIDYSVVDFNRAGTPLLEIVTQPDFVNADEVVAFAQFLRNICRFLGVSEGVMQKGHMRFEPNINTIITLDDGHIVKTPIVEIKNLNSFRSLRGAIEYEFKEQPERWKKDGKEMGPGAKSTRGWDDVKLVTLMQREKEDAHDYRYFPDPDLIPVQVSREWKEKVRERLPELPHVRARRYIHDYALHAKEAAALTDEHDVCLFYEETVEAIVQAIPGVLSDRAGRLAANMILQQGAKRANEQAVLVNELGITPGQIAEIVKLREEEKIGSSAADELFGLLCESGGSDGGSALRAESPPADKEDTAQRAVPPMTVEALAEQHNLLQVRDEGQLDAWIDEVLADPANAKTVEDVKGGKTAAIGRLVGGVMKRSGGAADAKAVRERLEEKLGG